MTPGARALLAAVGRTPLVRLSRLDADVEGVELWAKLEQHNPGGSVKDRPVVQMLADAEADGRLRAGAALIESSSGNTGIALALHGVARGYEVAVVMPESVPRARRRRLLELGATVIDSDGAAGSDGAIRLVRERVLREPGRYCYLDQYSSLSNPLAHERTTGPELLAALGPRLTHFVAGLGTTGTTVGTGRCLRRFLPSIEIVGVEPDQAAHGLVGLKHLATSIVPAIFAPDVLSRRVSVSTGDGLAMVERVARDEGLAVGPSSGANIAAAYRLAQRLCARGRAGVIAIIVCDDASRYGEEA